MNGNEKVESYKCNLRNATVRIVERETKKLSGTVWVKVDCQSKKLPECKNLICMFVQAGGKSPFK